MVRFGDYCELAPTCAPLLSSHLGLCSALLQPPLDFFCAVLHFVIGGSFIPRPCLTLTAP
jgi:hypothetical protein